MPQVPHLVYMSRGHGYGHAAVDRDIIAALRQLCPGIEIDLASYGTGLEFYRSHGIECTDLRIADHDDQGPQAMLRVAAFLRSRPHADLVVGHEIFAAPPICARLGLREVLLTHWLFSEVGFPGADDVLEGARTVMVLDFEQAHRVPQRLRGRLTFTGAVAKRLDSGRAAARRTLGIDDGEFVAVLTTGASYPAKEVHIRAVLTKTLAAWRIRHPARGRLFVLSGLTPPTDDASVQPVRWTSRPERYFQAADVVITVATFATMCTLARNRIPTLAVTGGSNPVDRLHSDFLAGQGLLDTVEVSISDNEMWRAIDAARGRPLPNAALPWATPTDVARRILACLGGSSPPPDTAPPA